MIQSMWTSILYFFVPWGCLIYARKCPWSSQSCILNSIHHGYNKNSCSKYMHVITTKALVFKNRFITNMIHTRARIQQGQGRRPGPLPCPGAAATPPHPRRSGRAGMAHVPGEPSRGAAWVGTVPYVRPPLTARRPGRDCSSAGRRSRRRARQCPSCAPPPRPRGSDLWHGATAPAPSGTVHPPCHLTQGMTLYTPHDHPPVSPLLLRTADWTCGLEWKKAHTYGSAEGG